MAIKQLSVSTGSRHRLFSRQTPIFWKGAGPGMEWFKITTRAPKVQSLFWRAGERANLHLELVGARARRDDDSVRRVSAHARLCTRLFLSEIFYTFSHTVPRDMRRSI